VPSRKFSQGTHRRKPGARAFKNNPQRRPNTMSRKIHREQGLLPIFSDLHLDEDGNTIKVEATFAVDVAIEKLAAAFYMDGSASMQDAKNYGDPGWSFLGFKIGLQRNRVKEAMRVIIPYIASKDANGRCRVAYWATDQGGARLEPIGELTAQEADVHEFGGPKLFGTGTQLVPALRDFVAYINNLQKGAEEVKVAYAIFVTDGQIHDYVAVKEYTREIAKAIMDAKFPRTVMMLVGVGPNVMHEQMEELSEMKIRNYKGRDIWCCAEADVVEDLPELVAHLLDENIPAFWGGATITDAAGRTLVAFEDMVPAVIEFELPKNAQKFFINASGKTMEQTMLFKEEEHE
jgi:hypothetical protein